MDVSNSQSVRRVLSEIFDKEGRIDWIVNTAGILDKQPLANMSYEAVHQSIDVNYLGNIIVAKESFFYLKESKGSLLFLLLALIHAEGRCIVYIHRLKLLL